MKRFLGSLVLTTVLLSGIAEAGAEYTVALQPVRDPKPVFATVESRNVVPARARIGGTVADLTIKEGDIVAPGQVIATVGDEKLASQMAALQAEADRTAADLARARDLAARGVIAKAQLDAAEAAAAAAQSRLAAQRQLMAEGAVLAPRAGRVLTVPVTSGTVIMPGEPVATIADETYVLRLRLPERHARFLKAGDSVVLSLATAGAPAVTGTITLVYPQIADGRVVADARVEGLGKYFVGERVRVLVASEERAALTVPQAFVQTRYGADYVLLKQPDGSAAEAPVQPGQAVQLPGGAAGLEILSGLSAGDVLVQP
jgi:RND family efflux transporter MFP subunit